MSLALSYTVRRGGIVMEFYTFAVDDPTACYQALLKLVHPQGVCCPGCGSRHGWRVHRSRRQPVLDYRCSHCQRVFNVWTGTPLQNTHLPPEVLRRLVQSLWHKEPLAAVARELGRPRSTLLRWQHRLRRLLRELSCASPPIRST
jgi:transposase-like protein